MPVLRKKLKNGYNYDNSIKNVSKQMEMQIIDNFKKKDDSLVKEEKFIASGVKKHMASFNKKIKDKIKNII
jgi:hypothetical protein